MSGNIQEDSALMEAVLRREFGATVDQTEFVWQDADQAFPRPVATYRLSLLWNNCLSGPATEYAGAEMLEGIQNVMMQVRAPGLAVEIEVAARDMMHQALSDAQKQLTPITYSWGREMNGFAWIVYQDLPGIVLAERFHSMTTQEQAGILSQIGEILQSLQRYQVPDTIEGLGFVEYDEWRRFVNILMDPHRRGYRSLETFHQATANFLLARADKCDVTRGWYPNGVRNRLDVFVSKGIPAVLSHVLSRHKVLVHATLLLKNLLFDPNTMLLTGITDFSNVHVGVMGDEFLTSFRDIGGSVPGPTYTDDPEMATLRRLLLTKFPRDLPLNSERINWEVAKMWDEEIRRRGLHAPGKIEGMAELSGLYWLMTIMCCSPDEYFRALTEWHILKYLESKGY